MPITVTIAKDKLSATVRLGDADQPTALEIRKTLQARGVIFGYLEDQIESLAENPIPGEIQIAVGDPPTVGADASVDYQFRTGKPDLTPQIGEDDRADFFNLGVVENAKPGQLLARKSPAVPGVPGRAVTGERIPAKPVKELNLRIGKGVQISSDGLEIRATEAGQPILVRGVVSISNTFTVTGDVDFSIGNVDFDGNVEVHGTVRNHFRVHATGNITVHGMVEGGILEAAGILMVVGGVRQRAVLQAQGDIQVRFIESSVVRTGGNLFVKDDLLASEVDVGGRVEVEGSLVGGRCKAEEFVKADCLGTKMGTPTNVELAPYQKYLEILHGLEQRQAEIKVNIDRLEDGIKSLDVVRERFHGLHPDKEVLYDRMSQALAALQRETVEVAGKVVQTRAKIDSLPEPKVFVVHTVYPGVHVRLNDAHFHNESELSLKEMHATDGKIVFVQ